MPDVIELGKRVKAKYPEYADMSDADVGRKVKAKYPEYNDFADVSDAPEKSVGGFIENAWKSAKKAGGQLVNMAEHPLDTAEALSPVFDLATAQTFSSPQKMAKGKKFADALIEDYGNAYGSWDKALETLYQDPVRVGMDVASLVPALSALKGTRAAGAAARMASTTGKVLKGATRGAVADAMAPAKFPSISVKGFPLEIDAEVPAIIANAGGGAAMGKMMGGTPGAVVGGVAGAARPVVRGAMRGGREALAEVRQAAANPPPLPVEPAPPLIPQQQPPPIPPQAAPALTMEEQFAASKPPASAPANATVAAEDFGTFQGVDAEGMAVYGTPGAVERANTSAHSPMQDFLRRKEQELRAKKDSPAIDPDSVIAKASPKAQQAAQDLAAMMGEDAAPPSAVQYKDGARAIKAFNVLDTLEQLKANATTVKKWGDAEWEQVVNATNDINTRLWEEGGKVGPKPNVHGVMGDKTRAEVIRLLKEVKARKATIQ